MPVTRSNPLVLLAGLFLAAALSASRAEELTVSFLGSPLTVAWTPPPAPVADFAGTIKAEAARLENLLGPGPEQWIGKLNASAGGDALEVPDELLSFLVRSREYWRMSEGAVDPSFGPLLRLWNFDERTYPSTPRVPAVREALGRVNFARVELRDRPPRVRLPADFVLDAGRLGRGAVVDRLHDLLQTAGVTVSRVEVAGILRVAGEPPGGSEGALRLHVPRKSFRTAATLRPANTAVATCAEDQRFIEIRGEWHHDVVDPRTGWPAQGCSSVTVVAPRAEYAQFLASTLMTMSPEVGKTYLRKHPGVGAVWVGMDNRIVATDSLAAFLEPAPTKP